MVEVCEPSVNVARQAGRMVSCCILMITRAQVADALTASRVVLAMLVAMTLALGAFPAAAVVLVVAWLTDLVDGRLARSAQTPTRLGGWDFRIDVSLGAAILVGLALSGSASPWLVVPVIGVLTAVTLLTGNPSPSMLLLAFAYAWFLWLLLDRRPLLWWLPFASILMLLVIDWQRFTRVILPAFFRGIATFGRAEHPEGGPILDLWA